MDNRLDKYSNALGAYEPYDYNVFGNMGMQGSGYVNRPMTGGCARCCGCAPMSGGYMNYDMPMGTREYDEELEYQPIGEGTREQWSECMSKKSGAQKASKVYNKSTGKCGRKPSPWGKFQKMNNGKGWSPAKMSAEYKKYKSTGQKTTKRKRKMPKTETCEEIDMLEMLE